MGFIVFSALFWGALSIWRIRLQVRFFQLEEYQNGRFLLWLQNKRERWLSNFFVMGTALGVVLGIILLALDVESPLIFMIVGIVAGAIAVYMPPATEVKKRFVATQRAKRLLATAFALAIVINLVGGLLLANAIDGDNKIIFAQNIFGLTVLFLAVMALPAANILNYPIEASMRQGFINKARKKLEQAQPVVIGITGSYGKTSTKQYLTHILNGRYRAIATPKSYNTLMGICLTINKDFDLTAGYQYFVVEMGAYVPGEIERICKLTKPNMSIVTAVGPQHLERFGSIENVQIAKYEIIAGLDADGIGIFNFDDPRVKAMSEKGYPNARYGISKSDTPDDDARLIATNVQQTLEGLQFHVIDRHTGEERDFRTTLIGLHNVTNILLAATAALETGMKLNEIALRVASLEPAEHRLRSNTLPNGITLIDDAYNTNPIGAANALQVLSLHQGRRVVVTPGMVELGDIQAEENRKLGTVAAQYATDIILVGKAQTAPIAEGIRNAGFDADHLHIMDTVQEAIDWYQSTLKSGDAILFLNDLADNYL